MPRQHQITPRKVGDSWRVFVPRDLSGSESDVTRWFPTKSAAHEHCATLMSQRGELGQGFFRLSQPDQALLLRALEAAGSAHGLMDAVTFWREQKPPQIATLKELAIRTVAAKEKSGKTDHYCACLRRSLQLFISGREADLAHGVQAHQIENWINSNARWSQNTKQTYLRDVRTMFSFGVKNGLLSSNPALKVERPSALDVSPAILSAQECERFMRAAPHVDAKLVQYLALCLFGGLRPSEAFRIQRENIREKHIEVFGKKVRARNRRLVTINPTLGAWLDGFPDGDFSPVNLQKRVYAIRAATAIGEQGPARPIVWPQDWMRHTFVSNHYAIHGAKSTANEAGHSETVLFQHYRELVTREEANKFWEILPK